MTSTKRRKHASGVAMDVVTAPRSDDTEYLTVHINSKFKRKWHGIARLS